MSVPFAFVVCFDIIGQQVFDREKAEVITHFVTPTLQMFLHLRVFLEV